MRLRLECSDPMVAAGQALIDCSSRATRERSRADASRWWLTRENITKETSNSRPSWRRTLNVRLGAPACGGYGKRWERNRTVGRRDMAIANGSPWLAGRAASARGGTKQECGRVGSLPKWRPSMALAPRIVGGVLRAVAAPPRAGGGTPCLGGPSG